MKLRQLWENLRNELIVDAAECMSSKLSDEDKMGKLVAMALKTDKVIGEAATEWDTLTATNQELLVKNQELLRRLDDVVKMQDMQVEIANGLYKRFDLTDEKIDAIKSVEKHSLKNKD